MAYPILLSLFSFVSRAALLGCGRARGNSRCDSRPLIRLPLAAAPSATCLASTVRVAFNRPLGASPASYVLAARPPASHRRADQRDKSERKRHGRNLFPVLVAFSRGAVMAGCLKAQPEQLAPSRNDPLLFLGLKRRAATSRGAKLARIAPDLSRSTA